MLASWHFSLTLIIGFFVAESCAFWPFSSGVFASAGNEEERTNGRREGGETAYASGVKRVAVIGAGAAGASTAWYLQKYADEAGIAINVTIFERNNYIGGRTTTVNAYGNPLEPVELGASIFVEVNAILKNSSELFGLKPRDSGTDEDEVLGIWNGKTFVYTQKDSGWKYWDIAKLFWKYGFAPIRTQRLMKSVVGKFEKLYQYPFFPFRSLTSRVHDLELVNITAQTGEQLLAANNIGVPFTTDIIQASTRVNYGQNLNSIHGLETMVCMAIEGAMQIAGGNWQIFDNMVRRSNATTLLNTTVSSISEIKGRYSIKSLSSASETGETLGNEEPYDTIVLAAPLQFSNITIDSGLLKHTPDEIPYVRLHVTLFTSQQRLNPGFFNITPGAEMPTTILTTLPPDEIPATPEDGAGSPGFFSISTLRSVINPVTLEKEYLYKIFSPKAVTPDFLSKLLNSSIPATFTGANSSITWYYPHVWHSYPYELPRVTFEDSELARGFYYTSGIESFISTMETSALMGMNVARLIVNEYQELREEEGGHDASTEKQQVIGEL